MIDSNNRVPMRRALIDCISEKIYAACPQEAKLYLDVYAILFSEDNTYLKLMVLLNDKYGELVSQAEMTKFIDKAFWVIAPTFPIQMAQTFREIISNLNVLSTNLLAYGTRSGSTDDSDNIFSIGEDIGVVVQPETSGRIFIFDLVEDKLAQLIYPADEGGDNTCHAGEKKVCLCNAVGPKGPHIILAVQLEGLEDVDADDIFESMISLASTSPEKIYVNEFQITVE